MRKTKNKAQGDFLPAQKDTNVKRCAITEILVFECMMKAAAEVQTVASSAASMLAKSPVVFPRFAGQRWARKKFRRPQHMLLEVLCRMDQFNMRSNFEPRSWNYMLGPWSTGGPPKCNCLRST